MYKLTALLFSAAFCGLVSCSSAGTPAKMVQSAEKTDSCRSDAKNSYEIYIPARENAGTKLPLLVVLDSHGAGKFALDKFRLAADRFPAIVVASNRIKNGFADYDNAVQALIADVRAKYPASEDVFLTGFSGGARMALGYALSHPVNGLILCGALASPDQINAVRCPVVSISGIDDFNFVETAQYLFQSQSIPAKLKIELTGASHAWPDSLMLANAWGFVSLTSAADPDNALVEQYCTAQHTRIDSLQQRGDLLAAALVARNMSATQPFTDDKAFADKYKTVQADPAYSGQLAKLEKCIRLEMNVRQPYIDAFQSKDSLWWRNEIQVTEQRIQSEPEASARDMYRRIKAFWGIASFSLCRQAVTAHNALALSKALAIYRMLEPENPDMFYFSAFIPLWKGDERATVSALKKAVAAGFTDVSLLKNDFPAAVSADF